MTTPKVESQPLALRLISLSVILFSAGLHFFLLLSLWQFYTDNFVDRQQIEAFLTVFILGTFAVYAVKDTLFVVIEQSLLLVDRFSGLETRDEFEHWRWLISLALLLPFYPLLAMMHQWHLEAGFIMTLIVILMCYRTNDLLNTYILNYNSTQDEEQDEEMEVVPHEL